MIRPFSLTGTVACMLGVSSARIIQLGNEGRIPFETTTSVRLYQEADVERLKQFLVERAVRRGPALGRRRKDPSPQKTETAFDVLARLVAESAAAGCPLSKGRARAALIRAGYSSPIAQDTVARAVSAGKVRVELGLSNNRPRRPANLLVPAKGKAGPNR